MEDSRPAVPTSLCWLCGTLARPGPTTLVDHGSPYGCLVHVHCFHDFRSTRMGTAYRAATGRRATVLDELRVRPHLPRGAGWSRALPTGRLRG